MVKLLSVIISHLTQIMEDSLYNPFWIIRILGTILLSFNNSGPLYVLTVRSIKRTYSVYRFATFIPVMVLCHLLKDFPAEFELRLGPWPTKRR